MSILKKAFQQKSIPFIIIAALFFCNLAFNNKFPIVHSDTGTYIRSGFEFKVPIERPIFYGLFIKGTSLGISLYLTIFIQGILLASILSYYFKYLLPIKNRYLLYIIFVFVWAFLMGGSRNVSLLSPDFFTSLNIMVLGLILFVPDFKKAEKVYLYFLLWLCMAVHNTHLLMSFGVMFCLLVTHVYKRYIRKDKIEPSGKKTILTLMVFMIIGYFSFSTINYIIDNNFTISKGGHVFMMARLSEIGVLKDYLDANCDNCNYELCKHKDAIPQDFIWNKNSPINKLGGWVECKEEFNKIIKDILSKPKYAAKFSIRAIESSFNQFFSFDMKNPRVMHKGSSPDYAIELHFKDQRRLYLDSKQNRKKMDYSFIDKTQKIIIALSFLAICYILFFSEATAFEKNIVLFFLLAIVLNACITGSLSGVFHRYQNRVIWILPLPILIVFARMFLLRKTKLNLFS